MHIANDIHVQQSEYDLELASCKSVRSIRMQLGVSLHSSGMELDGTSLIVSLLIGTVGFAAFAYGKKQGRLPQLVVGILLMVFPYFVPNPLLAGGITVTLLGLMWLAIRGGL